MAMELIKENIEYEQMLGENFSDTVVKSEYVVPDTHPDVVEILMLDARPIIVNKEVMQDKVYCEGQVEYTVMYLSKDEEGKSSMYSVNYTGKFSNYVDIPSVDHKMMCEAECFIEHMKCDIVNERKVAVEGIIKVKCAAYRNMEFEVVKDMEGDGNIQMLKNPATIDKIVGNTTSDMLAKSHFQVGSDKPQIGSILKCNIDVHKKEIKVLDGKIKLSAFCKVGVLYKVRDSRDIEYMEDDAFIEKEVDLEGVDPSMMSFGDMRVEATEMNLAEDDLGEMRIVDVEVLVKANVQVMCKKELDMIEDAFCPSMPMAMEKKDYGLNVLLGKNAAQCVVKGDIEIDRNLPRAAKAVMCNGRVSITDKKLVEGKVCVEGVVKATVLYLADSDERNLYTCSEEIPFSTTVEMPGAKIDMQSEVSASLESMEASAEVGNIAVKALVEVGSKVSYFKTREFLVDVTETDEIMPEKMSSITIYVVQQGDTLWKICKRYNTTMDTICKVNNLENPDFVKIGLKLIIPGRALI